MVDIAKAPYFRALFEKPFETYILMCFSMGQYEGYFRNGMSPKQVAEEQRKFYELTKHLLTTYKGTGKTFILQHWEGDWLIRAGFDRKADPTSTAISGMIAWLNARQAGVDQAKKEIGQNGVRVYHAAEVNRVVASMDQNRPGLVNAVLPHTKLDLVSYSAWDSVTDKYQNPEVFRRALDFIAKNMPDSPDFGDKNVFVGEFGMPENNFGEDKVKKAIPAAVNTALEWGCPYIVYWQLYCNEMKEKSTPTPVTENQDVRGFWLIKPDGTRTWAYEYFQDMLNPPAKFYIALNGNDDWSGRLPAPNAESTDGPFKTLARARNAVRMLSQSEKFPPAGALVNIRRGTYSLTETFELIADQDSGSDDAPIIYQAFENEEVRLIGGKAISGFKPITDPAILARISEPHRNKILQTNLKAQGITDFGRLRSRGFGRPGHPAALELFFDDKPMQLARYPNGEEWMKIAAVPAGKDGGKFTYEGDRPERWKQADDIWLHGYWTYDWADTYEKVKAINTKTKEIQTHPPHGAYGYTKDRRFRALNILEELDSPSEYYLDRKTGILYFYPPSPVEEAGAFVSILEKPLISMKDTANITFRRLILECTRAEGVRITGGRRNLIADCTIRNTGNRAVIITGGKSNGVAGCTIYETGDGGIAISGGDRKTLTPAGNFARDNHIHDYSRWCRTYRPAIGLNGVGNHIAHNLIHRGPHTGILFGGNDHLLEYNEIYNVCYETGDVGAFYTGRNWTTRGTVIRYNYFHDIEGPYTHGAMAVYLDDAASGTTIFGNIFVNASRAAFIGGGRDNTVENNIFIDCEPSVHIDSRATGWAKKYAVKGGGWHMYEKLAEVNHDKPPYSTRYPRLAKILEDDPALPEGNVIRRNISQGGRWLDLQGVDKSLVTFENNLVDTDPKFTDPNNRNFRLQPDSPAFKLGFKQIPTEKIGPRP
jgi:hypothetical protein